MNDVGKRPYRADGGDISTGRLKEIADNPYGDEEKCWLAKRVLASLEAEPAIHRWRRVTSEPYGPYPWHYGDFIGFSKPVDGIEDEYFYFAPPAPAKAKAEPVAWLWSHRKHPSEVTLVRPEDDEMAEGSGWSGWSCQALYAAQPAPVSVPDVHHSIIAEQLAHVLSNIGATDHQRAVISCAVDRLNKVSQLLQASPSALLVPEMLDYQGAKELYNYLMTEEETNATVNGWNACRAAMLQCVENTESRCTMQPASALDSLPQNADSRCSNSPVFPDGWVMVPVEPTEEMLAELCLVKGWTARALNARYQAMLAAAPKPEA